MTSLSTRISEFGRQFAQSRRVELGKWPSTQLHSASDADHPHGRRSIKLDHHLPASDRRPHIELLVVQTDLPAAIHPAGHYHPSQLIQHHFPGPLRSLPRHIVGPPRVTKTW